MKKTFILFLYPFLLFAKPTHTLFFGDTGTGEIDQYRVAMTMKRFCSENPCDLVLLLGDNFYPSGVSSTTDSQWKKKFLDAYETLGLPFYVTLGNHDYGGSIQAQIDYSRVFKNWILPSRYHAFRVNEVAFFSIDTNDLDSAQLEWLDGALENTRAEWKVVFGHHPVFSYGKHGGSKKLEKKLMPLLNDRADYYLSGHDHSMQWLKATRGVHFAVSGSAAQVTGVEKVEKTLFAAQELGFGYLAFDEKASHVQFLDGAGTSLMKADVARP